MQSLNENNSNLEKNTEKKPEKYFQKLKIVVIGAAGKKGNEYLNALMKRSDLEITAIVINKSITPTIEILEKQGTKIFRNGNIDALIATTAFDIAVISVPHNEHDSITQALLRAGKYIIKEKPLAMTSDQATQYQHIICERHTPPIFTTVQRDTLPAFVKAKEDLDIIGKPIKFTYEFALNLPSVTSGWRSKKATAIGGVILDMGYHSIDVISKFFGSPDKISSTVAYKYKETAQEGLEDRAEIAMEYKSNGLQGQIVLDRHAKERKEFFEIQGLHGSMIISTQGYQIFNSDGMLIKNEICPMSKDDEIDAMFKSAIPYNLNSEMLDQAFIRNLENVKTIERIYSCTQLKNTEASNKNLNYFHHQSIFSNNNNNFKEKSLLINTIKDGRLAPTIR